MMNFATEREGNIAQFLREDSRRENRGDENEDEGNHSNEIEHHQHDENESNQREQPFMRSKGNTGVKGVLADAASARELERVEREMDRMKVEYKMNKMAIRVDPNAKTQFSSTSNKRDEYYDRKEEEEEDDIDALLNDEDDEFFQQYKMQQMDQLRRQKTFGYLANITQAEFVSAIEDEDPRTFVVIHFYEDWHAGCVKLNKLLSNLATKLTSVKFIKIQSLEASETFEEVALPAISIYRGGNLVTAQLRVNELLPPAYDLDHLESFLSNLGVFQMK
eukprot:TRINITY_DN6865_c0_g1_i2.p1 TRINITY_DN6865_c0_g1~~TRINITY_DN6865_c0_g1_i2.p1  ORF type:complete len:285 (+),score=129.99 TRINITY_DN6865_c0_g1_i2:27-857(+)